MTYNLKKKLQTITTFYIYIYIKKMKSKNILKITLKKKELHQRELCIGFTTMLFFLFPVYVSKILTERVL